MWKSASLALVACIAAVAPAVPHEVRVGPITVTDLWARATPPGAKTAGGYLTITNSGSAPDRLVGVATPAAARGEIHQMSVAADVMTMKPADGVAIPAGESVTLAPGGFHLMFLGLMEPLVEGGEMPVTLTFEKAGSVETYLHVIAIGAMGLDGSVDAEHHEGH
jgi:copper(I)-binding protein